MQRIGYTAEWCYTCRAAEKYGIVDIIFW